MVRKRKKKREGKRRKGLSMNDQAAMITMDKRRTEREKNGNTR